MALTLDGKVFSWGEGQFYLTFPLQLVDICFMHSLIYIFFIILIQAKTENWATTIEPH